MINQIRRRTKKNSIPCLVQNNNKLSIGNFEINLVDFDAAINLRSEDFPKADKVLEEYYQKEIDKVDKDYYLFDFSTDELHEIIPKPYEWGQFDYALAKNY